MYVRMLRPEDDKVRRKKRPAKPLINEGFPCYASSREASLRRGRIVPAIFGGRRGHINHVKPFFYNLFTRFPQELHKVTLPVTLLVAVCCLAGLITCSTSKDAKKPKPTAPASNNALISSGPGEVRKKLGEPNVVSRTQEDHVLWVYTPHLKILPNDKGTVYVEFENGKVIKVFKKE